MTKQEFFECFYCDLHICGCVELDQVKLELERLLEWLNEPMDKRASFVALYPCIGTFYLLMSLLHTASLAEHGCSIRASWLSSKGIAFLQRLKSTTVEELDLNEGQQQS